MYVTLLWSVCLAHHGGDSWTDRPIPGRRRLMNGSIDAARARTQVEHIRLLALVCLLCVVTLATAYLPTAHASDPVTAGYRDFSYGTSGVAEPTGEKPESKLWWNDGLWW